MGANNGVQDCMCHLSLFLQVYQQLIFCVKGNQVRSISLTIWLVCWCRSQIHFGRFSLKVFVSHLLIMKPELSIISWYHLYVVNTNCKFKWICVWISDKAPEWRYTFPDPGWDSRWDQTTWHHPKTETVAHEWGRHMYYLHYKCHFYQIQTVFPYLFILLMYICCIDECWWSYIFEDVWHLTALYTNRLEYLCADISFVNLRH